MINDNVKATGEVKLVLRDSNGNVKSQTTIPNLVVTVGKAVIASRLTGNSVPVMSHMAVGTNATVQIAANTSLGTEIGRTALTTAGGVAANNEITYVATFGPGVGTGALTEVGILNDATVGTLLARTTFGVVSKDVGDSLTVNWKITIS